MASGSLDAFVQAVDEITELQRADPTPQGKPPNEPATTRVIGRASVALLSSHFERYIYAVNEEATGVINAVTVAGASLPELLKLLHSRTSVDAMLKTDWEHRAEQLRTFIESEAWLWSKQQVGMLNHEQLLTWMKAPTPKNLVRYYRYWDIEDIFSAVTRAVHTRTDLWLKIEELVRKRNNIAHGDLTTEATSADIRSYRDAALRFCERSDRQLARALGRILACPAPW
jgi:RiboL-PSP-HEPN